CVDGVAFRGLLVRHLVLPGGLAGSRKVLGFIAGEISRDAYVNVMAQYRWPENLQLPDDVGSPVKQSLLRGITPAEYNEAIACAEATGLHRGISHLR
ncbi:MAG: radical SAM protein, partial [Methanoregulaceae archaeon]|nr:radical SAM protein [Methanoregulaceae archaeon]